MYATFMRLLLALCLVAFVTLSTVAQDKTAIAGKWNMTSETDSDSISWTLIIKETDGKLEATLGSDDGQVPAKNLTYEAGVLKFKAPYNDEDYDIELKLTGSELTGTWSGESGSGKTHGTKAP